MPDSAPERVAPERRHPARVEPGRPEYERLAEVAAAVGGHPDVDRLDAGPFGAVASLLPGRRRVVGVRVGAPAEPVELGVVVRFGRTLPELADELAALVIALLGPVAVEVTFCDVVSAPEPVAAGGDRS
jgi:hypothetical protein